MRQLYPLRPLTEAGRVLLCIAASLFAALLLVAWTAVPADDASSAPTFTSAAEAR
jgi:Ca-activated chloride channel family protein